MSDIDHMYLQQQLMKITLKKIASPSRNSNDKEKEKKKQKKQKMEIASLFALHTNAVSLSNHPARIDFCEKIEIPTKKNTNILTKNSILATTKFSHLY